MTAVLTAYPTATTFAPIHLDGADWSQVGPALRVTACSNIEVQGLP